ncbi:MAG: hypothetical protein ACE5IO_01825, partial [Thermoplasmata archaeon]
MQVLVSFAQECGGVGMERRIRLVLVGLMVCAFTTGLLILPVAAEVLRPPDYTVEYYDQIIRDKGYWYEPENVALEGGGIGGYL